MEAGFSKRPMEIEEIVKLPGIYEKIFLVTNSAGENKFSPFNAFIKLEGSVIIRR